MTVACSDQFSSPVAGWHRGHSCRLKEALGRRELLTGEDRSRLGCTGAACAQRSILPGVCRWWRRARLGEALHPAAECSLGLVAELSTAVENPAANDRADYEHDSRHLCNTAGADPIPVCPSSRRPVMLATPSQPKKPTNQAGTRGTAQPAGPSATTLST